MEQYSPSVLLYTVHLITVKHGYAFCIAVAASSDFCSESWTFSRGGMELLAARVRCLSARGTGVIKIWGPRRFGDPPSPILRRNGDPCVKMATLTHTVVGKGRSLSNLSQEERISATDE